MKTHPNGHNKQSGDPVPFPQRPGVPALPQRLEEIITTKEVAELCHKTPQWVRGQCRSRCKDPMPHIKRGREFFFVEAEVIAWFLKGRRK